MRRLDRPIFALNVWPPFVDVLTLVLAAFVLIMLVGAVAQRSLLHELNQRDREMQRLKQDKARIEARLAALGRAGIEVDGDKVILQGEVLFDSGSAGLTPAGTDFLLQLGPLLNALMVEEPDQMVLVGGHTDDVPIHNADFASNWDLSAARAVAVATFLSTHGVPERQLVAAGFGPHHPRVANADDETRRQNRRIEVLLLPIKAVTTP